MASAISVLADWFTEEVLGKELTPNRFRTPEYRRLMSQFAYMLHKPDAVKPGLGMSPERVKTAIKLMRRHGVNLYSPNMVYLSDNKQFGATWYDLADDPMQFAPPVYCQKELEWFRQEFAA